MSRTWERIREPGDGPALLEAYLAAHPQTEFIACQALSWGNVLHVMHFLPLTRARAVAAGESNFFLSNLSWLQTSVGKMSGEFWDSSKITDYRPDWTTLKPSATNPKQAKVMCETWWGPKDGEASLETDARDALRRVEGRLKALGLDVLVGTEIEFSILKGSRDGTLYPTHHNLISSAVNREPILPMVEDAVKAVETAGVPVFKYHPEFHGNWEVVLGPLSPVVAADGLVHANEAIRDVAHKHGFLASVHPWPSAQQQLGNGQHFHMSINGPTADAQADHFLAGLLIHLPAVWPFLKASCESYVHQRQGGLGISWSHCRSTQIQAISKTRWEVRIPDGLGNPYLQLAALLSAGLAGIENKSEVPSRPLDSLWKRGSTLSEEELKEHGVEHTKEPETLEDALAFLEKDQKEQRGLSATLGDQLAADYLKYKRIELAQMKQMDPGERRKQLIYHI